MATRNRRLSGTWDTIGIAADGRLSVIVSFAVAPLQWRVTDGVRPDDESSLSEEGFQGHQFRNNTEEIILEEGEWLSVQGQRGSIISLTTTEL